ncbi:ribonuclease BN [Rhodococcus sp. Leaf278]|uniref:YihY/virulence factor BrkB family protein n=1 Tax=Rhodococcus sp. Leaf278 TaxID=1736319 RepID=UPI00070D69DD|nr:YihY/virulence factor BrkB family protein [Rhodococcus sp. Leaf278]KQU53674.1 ribonuclease BN [Rhodococcus sp. Leaf278]
MSVADRLDRLQRRRPALGYPIAVVYKFVDDQGGYLAALITYYAFVSLFPALLLFSTVLGIVLVGSPELQQQILDSALGQIPVIGDELGQPDRISGGVVGLVVGGLGSLYGGLGVSVALQNATNTAWSVPKNVRPDPIRARVRGLGLLGTVGIATLTITAVNVLSAAGYFGPEAGPIVFTVATLLYVAVFVVAFRLATARPLSVREVLPGAIAAGIIWQLLQSFGSVYVKYVVSNATVTNGVFAVVLGLLAFLYVTSLSVVMCIEINVVRVDRLFPRALLAPFTDDVELTEGDKLTYTGQAEAQRSTAFEEIDVTFEDPPSVQSDSDSDSESEAETP